MRRFFNLVLAIISVFFLQSAAQACSCAYSDPEMSFNSAKVIFVGEMLGGTEQFTFKNPVDKFEAGDVRFKVIEIFKGGASETITVHIASMKGTSCGPYGLVRGTQYVVYAFATETKPEVLYTGVCTRTAEIASKNAKDDLAFLRNLPPPGAGGTIEGIVRADVRERRTRPMPNLKIKITRAGGKPTVVLTDKEGDFRISGLKAGKYTVEVALPENYTTEDAVHTIDLNDRGKAVTGFELYINGRITGRIVDRTGRPYNDIFLHLEDGEKRSLYGHSTRKNGQFEVYGVPPGSYVLYLRLEGDHWDKERPYYYPGTFDKSKARTIDVGLARSVDVADFPLPDGYNVRIIEGQVLWNSGKPAAKVEVNLLCPTSVTKGGFVVEFGARSTQTDDEGRFRIEGFTGEWYILEARAGQPSNDGEERLLHSPALKVQLDRDMKDLTLRLSKPGHSSGCQEGN